MLVVYEPACSDITVLQKWKDVSWCKRKTNLSM